jgi:D-alanyl-D-alanine carboxypeptidase/D-alanyl-D-alanine-endopeptidase (penicillin-binding protein 4)
MVQAGMRSGPARTVSRRGFLTAAALFAVSRARAAEPERALSPRARRELEDLASFAESSKLELGASITDALSGRELFAFAAEQARNPASNQKLVTAAAALRHLGAEFTFRTAVCGRVSEGRLTALVLRSNGDPSLSAAAFEEMARELSARGVREVHDILVDQSAFDRRWVPPGFEQQPEEWAAFRAPVSAVAFERNSVVVNVTPGRAGSRAEIRFEPGGFVDVLGSIATDTAGKKQRIRVGLAPLGSRLVARVSGSIGPEHGPLRYRLRVDEPSVFAGYGLRRALEVIGLKVTGAVCEGGQSERNELVVRRSRPLAELLAELGKDSDNFYAETVLKALGGELRGHPASSAAGAEVALGYLREIGAPLDGVAITNGSGLFDSNRLSPRTLTALLGAAYRDPKLSAAFVEHLAIGGVDGTLQHRFKKLAGDRAVRAKTGTLSNAVALSGYVFGAHRANPLAFSILIEGTKGRAASVRQRVDQAVEALARESG